MNNHRSTVVIFACHKCGQPYRTTQQRFPYERPGRFDCIKCNAQVHAWRGFFDFMDWNAIAPDGTGQIAKSERHYHVIQAENGSVTVNIYADDGKEASTMSFDSRERALDWIREQRQGPG
jgi:hypothetical protein